MMNELKIVKGNTFSTAIKVRAYTYDGEEITDIILPDIGLSNIQYIVLKQ